MKTYLLPLLLLLLTPRPATAQDFLPTEALSDSTTEDGNEVDLLSLPWVIDLSNLVKADRDAYVEAFDAAKVAYREGRLVECESWLNTCELIYDKNPNVWNLRASTLVAQKKFDEAEHCLRKVLELLPNSDVAHLNLSLLFLGRGDYEDCLAETNEVLNKISGKKEMRALKQSLVFRKFLSLLMMKREEEALILVEDLTPLEDSPLYYYSQAALLLSRNDSRAAQKELSTANAIYETDPYLYSYKQNLKFSGLMENPREGGKTADSIPATTQP